MTHYEILQVGTNADFRQLKKAYFKRAKACHPDRHNNSREKEEEFKLVVAAFDVLSDPEKRYNYDNVIGVSQNKSDSRQTVQYFAGHSIMDTPADDILEELIVGNYLPKNATLMTLMMDLQKTDVFVNFREGKNLFYNKKYNQALSYFQRAVAYAPMNILYHCFVARTLAFKGKYAQAKYHYKNALDLGRKRVPMQHLEQIRKELKAIRKKDLPWWARILGYRYDEDDSLFIKGSDQQMIEETNDTIERILKEKKRKNKKLLE
jgi:curved DNA-binding protein CbpA